MQLASAYATMMNGGQLIQPHVVQAVGVNARQLPAKGTVITPDLSHTLVGMMNHVVSTVPFYRDRTLIPGFEVGGKTGTAQIWDTKANGGRGAWKHNIFNYSFVGYIARTPGHPDLVVGIRIEEGTPTVAKLGQLEMPVMSFELFRRIAHDAITTPDLLPDRTDVPLPATAGTDGTTGTGSTTGTDTTTGAGATQSTTATR
jgi:cell division protein FtsI/penicillin-binding protein 2